MKACLFILIVCAITGCSVPVIKPVSTVKPYAAALPLPPLPSARATVRPTLRMASLSAVVSAPVPFTLHWTYSQFPVSGTVAVQSATKLVGPWLTLAQWPIAAPSDTYTVTNVSSARFFRLAITNAIRLAWSPESDPAVTGYRVYQGVRSRNYSETYDAGTNAVCAVVLLPAENFFAVTSLGALGESGYSDELICTNLTSPTLTIQ